MSHTQVPTQRWALSRSNPAQRLLPALCFHDLQLMTATSQAPRSLGRHTSNDAKCPYFLAGVGRQQRAQRARGQGGEAGRGGDA